MSAHESEKKKSDATLGGPSSRWAITISAISALISAVSLAVNAYNYYATFQFQQQTNQINAAVSWCKDFFLPSFVNYQAIARKLRQERYKLPDNHNVSTIHDFGDISILERHLEANDIHREEIEEIMISIVGLMNYIETGAMLVKQGNMEKSRFASCFREFKDAYFDRLDTTYVGLYLYFQNGRLAPKEFFNVMEEVMPSAQP
jgi:hypothetical protein